MHADVLVDDELQAREADALVGQALECERELGVADVHHDLGRRRRHAVERDVVDDDRQQAGVDVARVAFRTGHGHRIAFGEHLGGIAAADDRGNAKLARDDRRMAGATAAVGDDRPRALHHRLPVGVGHLGDQHVARLHAVHFGGGADEPHRALPDLLTDRASARQHLGGLLEAIPAQRIVGVLRAHGFRPRLQHVELAVVTVAAPFDVHRALVMLLDGHRDARELLDFRIGQRKPHAIGGRDLLGAGRAPGGRGVGEHHPCRLGTHALAQDRGLAAREVVLPDVELVRVHDPLHHRFAEAVRGRDEHDAAEPGFGVHREHHAGRARVAADHALHAGRKCDVGVRIALVHAVRDRAVVVERGEYLLYRLKNVLQATDIKECFLLSSERGVGHVFGGRRRTHSECRPGRRLFQRRIRGANFGLERSRQWR